MIEDHILNFVPDFFFLEKIAGTGMKKPPP